MRRRGVGRRRLVHADDPHRHQAAPPPQHHRHPLLVRHQLRHPVGHRTGGLVSHCHSAAQVRGTRPPSRPPLGFSQAPRASRSAALRPTASSSASSLFTAHASLVHCSLSLGQRRPGCCLSAHWLSTGGRRWLTPYRAARPRNDRPTSVERRGAEALASNCRNQPPLARWPAALQSWSLPTGSPLSLLPAPCCSSYRPAVPLTDSPRCPFNWPPAAAPTVLEPLLLHRPPIPDIPGPSHRQR